MPCAGCCWGATCSTPFGINGRNTRIGRPGLEVLLGAQRLSASTEGTLSGDDGLQFHGNVLNAFRHQRKEHDQRTAARGHKFGAQRLSASTEGTLARGAFCDADPECSTPFGINGRNTQLSQVGRWEREGAQRLSASTEGTLWPGPGIWPIRCAQRLSASTEGTPVQRVSQFLPGFCAQRLSASTEGTPARGSWSPGSACVLNAFRHQRKEHLDNMPLRNQEELCSTPFGINGRNTTRRATQPQSLFRCSTPFGINGRNTSGLGFCARCDAVLNAFRHQRKEHVLRGRNGAGKSQCSTPFGINGRNTARSRRHVGGVVVLNAFRHQRKEHVFGHQNGRLREVVLNAFRHQRKEHDGGRLPPFSGAVCSTPFGINGRNTRRGCKSRPAGNVLNAFRHQRKEHGCSQTRHVASIACCAQRLSASTEGTRRDRRAATGGRSVLNAFRHQRKEH